MERTDLLKMTRKGCSVAGVLEIVGERWSMLVIREAFFGLRRFDDFQKKVGCARNVLTERLATLVDRGVLRKEPYREEGQRERFEYRLTPAGHELYPVLQSLRQWGDRWLHDGHAPLEVFHRDCGGLVRAEVRCERCDAGPLHARETDAAPRDGERGRARRVSAARRQLSPAARAGR